MVFQSWLSQNKPIWPPRLSIYRSGGVESEFEVQASKKVTVEIKSQNKKRIKESKSSVRILSQPTLTEKQHIINIIKMLIKERINIKNLHIKKNKLNNIVATYIQKNPITENQKGAVIEKVIKVLDKRK